MAGVSDEEAQGGGRTVMNELREMARSIADGYRRFAQALSAWAEEHEDGIVAVMASARVWATVQPELKRLWEKWQQTPWGHLLWELDFSNAFGLMLLLDREQTETIEDVLEPALTDTQFLAKVRTAIATAPVPEAHRRQLTAGLSFIAERDYELAVPLLIVPLEGAFWRVAQDRELVERVKGRMRFTGEVVGRPAQSVEAIFEPLGVDEDFRRFLLGLVYSTSGHPFRHGSAERGWRRSALLLVVALVGWLDLYADTKEGPASRDIQAPQ
jgi:hypothetical protein